MSPAPGCREENGEKPLVLVTTIPGEGEDLGGCRCFLSPPPIRRVGPLRGLASACLASSRSNSFLPSEDSEMIGSKLAKGQLFLCSLTSRVKVKPLNQQVEKTFSSASFWEVGR